MTEADALPPPPAPWHKRPALLLGAGAVLVLVLLFGLWLASRPGPEQLQGMVDADEINVATKAIARVDRLIASEGDRVTAGQLLATLTSPEIANGRTQAQGALDSAKALAAIADEGARGEDIASLRAVWQAAEAAATLARTSAARADQLYAQGVIAAQRRDEAHAAREASARQAEAAQQQYRKALAGTRPENKAVARAQVQIASAGVATADALVAETQLVAPVAGEIARRLAEPGEIVATAVPVYQIVAIDHPWVSLTLREDRYRNMGVGRLIHGDVPALGVKGAPFRVYFVSPQADFATWRATRQSAGFDVRAFEIRLRPDRPIKGLRPGMSVLFDWPQ
ncbi:MAG TPA: HlyD family efflux transporter periplasmic adaptor subunit [Sphingobium sp.]|nr:HlyD family efflux transporter periplasmic adaptor subunit [Sphingobium sp.]